MVIQLGLPLSVMERSKIWNSLTCLSSSSSADCKEGPGSSRPAKAPCNVVTTHGEIPVFLPDHTGNAGKAPSLSTSPRSPPAMQGSPFGKALKNLQVRFLSCWAGLREEEEVRKDTSVYMGLHTDGGFCHHQQLSVLSSQAKITFNSQGSLLPQILFRLSHCSTADSFGCPFIFYIYIFFDSIKYILQRAINQWFIRE